MPILIILGIACFNCCDKTSKDPAILELISLSLKIVALWLHVEKKIDKNVHCRVENKI